MVIMHYEFESIVELENVSDYPCGLVSYRIVWPSKGRAPPAARVAVDENLVTSAGVALPATRRLSLDPVLTYIHTDKHTWI